MSRRNMNKKYIVANWKSYKTLDEAEDWLDVFIETPLTFNEEEKEVVICPSFMSLALMDAYLDEKDVPVFLGAQDVSPFDEGAFTGEVNAKQVKECADYAIIGHSERRSNFHEDDALLAKKVEKALSLDIEPIFCIQGKETPIPDGVSIVAYEPVEAIGSGKPDSPDDAEAVAKTVKTEHPTVKVVLYGGSVTAELVNSFTSRPAIDGVLVGGASLDASEFRKIIDNA